MGRIGPEMGGKAKEICEKSEKVWSENVCVCFARCATDKIIASDAKSGRSFGLREKMF